MTPQRKTLLALNRLDDGAYLVMLEELRPEVGLDLAQMRSGLQALANADPPYIASRLHGWPFPASLADT
jgi:hypothetical protein